MGYYRRMEQHFGGNLMSTTWLRYQLRDMWKSPRGTVLYIEALALVAIILSFYVVTFGSCRRWSNRWIVQKGFLAAQVLSLSLGTYSIGLMQSSSVKSEMYPIWAVSLLTLFVSVDPVTTYIGLDYKGPLSKMVFQLCLYFWYVVLMSMSSISSDVARVAICVLSSITFVKGFHRSLAFVLPRRTREEIGRLEPTEPAALAGEGQVLKVHLLGYLFERQKKGVVFEPTMADIQLKEVIGSSDMTFEDVCLGYSLSHLLKRRFLGMSSDTEMEKKRKGFESLVGAGGLVIDYKRTLKVIEVELAFLYEVYFTSNEFLYLYKVKTSSLWALASIAGIFFVGVAAIPSPSTNKASPHHRNITSPAGLGPSTIVVHTTTADQILTVFILVSLALLQLLLLIRCWTSNWARVTFACQYAENQQEHDQASLTQMSHWMRLRAFIFTKVKWFDEYLWQDQLGQHSLVLARRSVLQRFCECLCGCFVLGLCKKCEGFLAMVGLDYIVDVLRELFVSDTKTGDAIRLHDDVKTSVAEFLGQIKSRRIGAEWSSLFVDNGLTEILDLLPYSLQHGGAVPDAHAFMRRVMIWHIATCYCEEAEKEGGGQDDSSRENAKHRRVAIDLSRYFTYLVVSAPELLPGPAMETKAAFDRVVQETEYAVREDSNMVEAMQRVSVSSGLKIKRREFSTGVYLGMRLRNKAPPPPVTAGEQQSDHWELLALVWVQTLLYAAPYGDMQAHMERLSQGGEFITHLWALLFHLGIDQWQVAGIDELKAAAAAETTTEAHVQEDAGRGSEIEEMK